MAVMTNTQPIVGAYGDIYSAAAGTPVPTNIDDPGPAWTMLGMISEDGASWTPPEEETEEIKIWQSMYPARVVTTGLSSSISFALDGWDRVTIPFALGGGTFDDVVGPPAQVVYHPPGAGEAETRALFLKVLDGPVKMGLYFAKGRIISRDDAVFKPDEAALLQVEFGLLGDPNYEPYNLVFDATSFPAEAVAATGATAAAGAAGAWTPAGATAPADLAAANADVTGNVTPATTWAGSGTLGVPGSYMVLGDNTHCYWDGAAWVTGNGPATAALRKNGGAE